VIDLSFEPAVFGVELEVPLTLAVACPNCEGSGARPGTTPISCPDCHGAGEVRRVRQSLLGQMVTSMPCARCHGTGEHVPSPCPECRGEGRLPQSRTISVQVPPGVDNGSTLRVAGQGPMSPRSRGAGDLYVHLRVAPHDRFERSHNDLLVTLHVQMTHAALGAEIELETLEGPQVLTIAPGTQSGKLLRIRGRGVPDVHRGKRGDLLVRVNVDTPTHLSKREDELLRQFAETRGDDVAKPESGIFSRIKSSLT
jgi:molecular chaperone DnaJ